MAILGHALSLYLKDRSKKDGSLIGWIAKPSVSVQRNLLMVHTMQDLVHPMIRIDIKCDKCRKLLRTAYIYPERVSNNLRALFIKEHQCVAKTAAPETQK